MHCDGPQRQHEQRQEAAASTHTRVPALSQAADPALVDSALVDSIALMGNTNAYCAGGMLIGWVTGSDEIRHVFDELLYSHWIASLTRKSVGRSIGRAAGADSTTASRSGSTGPPTPCWARSGATRSRAS